MYYNALYMSLEETTEVSLVLIESVTELNKFKEACMIVYRAAAIDYFCNGGIV